MTDFSLQESAKQLAKLLNEEAPTRLAQLRREFGIQPKTHFELMTQAVDAALAEDARQAFKFEDARGIIDLGDEKAVDAVRRLRGSWG